MTDRGTFSSRLKTDLSFTTAKSFEHRVPTSRSFSFNVSGFWKPTKEPFLQWIKGIPEPAPKEEAIEPARYHTLKHGLDHGDSDNDSTTHREKRAKVSSEPRQSKVLGANDLVRRVSGACQRVVTPMRNRSTSQQKTGSWRSRGVTPAVEPIPGPSSGTASFTLIDRPKMRFVFVGDSQCGKTSALLRFHRDTFSSSYTPTQYDLFHKVVKVDGQDIDVELWDTSGNLALEQLSRLNYLAWDCVFLCFSVSSPRSFNSARNRWIHHIRRHTRGAPLILVGMKTDLRVGASLWSPLYPDLDTRITATEGVMVAEAIGATKYVECSAKTCQGINGVIEDGVCTVNKCRDAVKPLEKPSSGFADLLCFK